MPNVVTGKSEAQPNQKIPFITGTGNHRKEYNAYQGERPEERDGDPSGIRKPGN
jgi:hypothetical protein